MEIPIWKFFEKFLSLNQKDLNNLKKYKDPLYKRNGKNVDYIIDYEVSKDILNNDKLLKQEMLNITIPCIDLLSRNIDVQSFTIFYSTVFNNYKSNNIEILFQKYHHDQQRFFINLIEEK